MYLSFHLLWLLECCEHCFHFSRWTNTPFAWSLFTLDCDFLKCSEYLFHFSPKKDSSLLYISQCKYYSPNMASISHLEHAICMNLSPRDFPFWTPKPFTTSLTKTFFLTQDTLFFFFFGSAWKLLLSFTKTFSPPKKKHHMYIGTQPKKSHLNLLLLWSDTHPEMHNFVVNEKHFGKHSCEFYFPLPSKVEQN